MSVISPSLASPSSSPLDSVLTPRQELSAVEAFASRQRSADEPSDGFYRSLIPLSLPQAGQQYAFEVDLDACSGCKACVVACHNLNGLEEDELWRSVGLLHGGGPQLPIVQHVTTACHHCLEPACLQGCPVRAYEKDPQTGIVRHLDEQCIGCQYCTLTCPYDVPKYSKRQGIVRKCDMCRTRLSVGEAPACVQACPTRAIRITLVDRQEAADNCETNLFLPGAPEPEHTLPTTIYKTSRPLAGNLLPADYYSAAPQHAHWPLVVMLVLTQASVGVLLAERCLMAMAGGRSGGIVHESAINLAFLLGGLGIGASVLHLGRPWYAFRAVLGLRTSWLSREIMAFACYGLLMLASALLTWLDRWGVRVPANWASASEVTACVWGILGVACSVMIYARTRRAFWSAGLTGAKFSLTCAVLGFAALALIAALVDLCSPDVNADAAIAELRLRACRWLAAAMLVKLACEATVFAHLGRTRHGPLKRTALLMTGDLKSITQARFALGCFGGVVLPLVMASGFSLEAADGGPTIVAALVYASIVASVAIGELMERYLFFTAVVAPKMPGAPAS